MNRFTLIFLFVIFFKGTEAQSIKSFSNIHEEVILTTDRELYFTEEEIFFRADYFINGTKTYPALSKVLYIELINCQNNKPVIQKKFKIIDWTATGRLAVPQDIITGNYMLRAYTQYQRNYSDLGYGYHFLTIIQPVTAFSSATNTNKDSIYIAPESGILVQRCQNKIVIKIPESMVEQSKSYFISDQYNNPVQELNPTKDGFIQTDLYPVEMQYSLTIIKNNGERIIKKFPPIAEKGIQTNINQIENSIYYKIQCNGSYSRQQPELSIRVLSSNAETGYNKYFHLKDSVFTIRIPGNEFYTGINYIVLMDKHDSIIKVNSFYKTPDYKKIHIKTDKATYNQRETVNMSIYKDNLEELDCIYTSLAVTMSGTNMDDYNFNPSLFFSHPLFLENFLDQSYNLDNEIKNQIMILFDNFFNLKSVVQEVISSNYDSLTYIPETRGVTINGILRNKITKKPVANHKVYLSVLEKSPQLHAYTTKYGGKFIFPLQNVYGVNNTVLCPENDADIDDEYEILIRNMFSGQIPKINAETILVDERNLDLLQKLYINKQIQQNFPTKQLVSVKEEDYKTKSFNLNDNKITVITDNYIQLDNMRELLFELVPNVVVSKSKTGVVFKILDENWYTLPWKPLVLLDYMPVFDPNKIMELDPAQVKKIEVIPKIYILGSHTINGVLAIFTNTDNFADIKLPASATFVEYQMLENSNVELGTNNFNIDSPKKVPDFRTTLCWNPNLKLTQKEKLVKIRTSDRKGTYTVIIKGYSANGQIYIGKKQITIN